MTTTPTTINSSNSSSSSSLAPATKPRCAGRFRSMGSASTAKNASLPTEDKNYAQLTAIPSTRRTCAVLTTASDFVRTVRVATLFTPWTNCDPDQPHPKRRRTELATELMEPPSNSYRCSAALEVVAPPTTRPTHGRSTTTWTTPIPAQ